MKQRYILFRRGGVFYCEDTDTRKQVSLRTKDEGEALTLLHAKNESVRQPILNLQIARTYLSATDPEIALRTWQAVMDEMVSDKKGPTLIRYQRAMQDGAFDLIRDIPILETQSLQLLKVLRAGTVATNIFLRRIHNFAVGMGWLPWPILAKKQWPPVRFKEKRAITSKEHQAIVQKELNPERSAFYECCWLLGGAQSDIASLTADDIDWENRVVSFSRKKTGIASIIRFGSELETVLKTLPRFGALFPNLQRMRESQCGYFPTWLAYGRSPSDLSPAYKTTLEIVKIRETKMICAKTASFFSTTNDLTADNLPPQTPILILNAF